MPYVNNRDYDLIDLLIENEQVYKVTIRDGSSGDTGDKYGIAINEKAVSPDPEDPRQVYQSAAVVTDGTPGSDVSSTIASDLATELNNSTKPVSANASGDTVTITQADDHKFQELNVEVFTTDDEGAILVNEKTPEAYEVQNASNFDAPFTTMETIPRAGLRSASVSPPPSTGSESSSLRRYTRFLFDPADYSLDDTDLFFFKTAPVIDGVTQSSSSMWIALSSEQLYESHPSIVLQGAAPKATDADSALELNFPYQTSSIVVKHTGDAADNIYLSFTGTDGEWTLGQGEEFKDNKISTWDIKVRTDNGATSAQEVSIYITLNTEQKL